VRYLGVSWEDQRYEYFYSFFDPNQGEWLPLPMPASAENLILIGHERLALCGPGGDLGPRAQA